MILASWTDALTPRDGRPGEERERRPTRPAAHQTVGAGRAGGGVIGVLAGSRVFVT